MAATWSAEKALVEIISKKTNNPTLATEARMGHERMRAGTARLGRGSAQVEKGHRSRAAPDATTKAAAPARGAAGWNYVQCYSRPNAEWCLWCGSQKWV